MISYPGDVSGNPSLAELLDRVRDRCLAAFSRQDIPFAQLVEALAPERSPAYNPLVQVTMTLQDASDMDMDLPGATLERADPDTATVQFDIEMDVVPSGDGLTCVLRYSTDLFDPPTMGRLSRHVERVWECLSSTPERRLDEVELLDERAREESRRLETGPTRELNPALTHRLVAALAQQPGRIAVEAPDGRYSRAELSARARRIAAALVSAGVRHGDLVGVAMSRRRDLPASLLAVWAAGAAYVPMDPTYPRQRLAQMAEDSGIRAVVTTREQAGRLPLATGVTVIDMDGPLPGADDTWPVAMASGADLAYVIYTSGSTGRPKGVMVELGNLANVLDAFAHWPGFSADDRMLALTSLSFDIAGLELFLPLLTGGTLIIAPEGVGGDPAHLHALLTEHRATVVQATPATWKLYTAYTSNPPPELRQIWSGGERLPHALAKALTALVPAVYNLYGPTETTIWSTCAALAPDDDHTGIGRPVDNTRLHVVDEHGRPVPPGIPGELWISGAGVARGYLGLPALTAERFIQHDGVRAYRTGDVVRWRSDRTLEFLHRIDEQVKIRGHRVEPGEVDSVVRALPGVLDSCTISRSSSADDVELVTYIVPAAEGLVTDEVRARLAEKLPAYMLPAVLMVLRQLPLTPNGKTDRAALPEPQPPTSSSAAPPTTGTERGIATIWCDVLGIPAVGRDDDFFSVGGHSLSATRVIARMRQELGVAVGLTEFFAHPTLRALAAHVDVLTMRGPSLDGTTIGRVERSKYRRTGRVHND